MKSKLLFIAALLGAASLAFTACNDDDDYTIVKEPLLTAESVVTGSADVTATTATLHATIDGLSNTQSSFYVAGFKYGYTPEALTGEVAGELTDGVLTATLTGLTEGTVLYYKAFVTLKGRVTYEGQVNSLVTTDARVTTAAASGVDFAGATLAGTVSGATADAANGFVIAVSPAEEDVRAGLLVKAADPSAASFSLAKEGLAPNTTYYYAAVCDLGSGKVYGEVQSFTTGKDPFSLDDELVDLGLSVKWAKRNIGARTASSLGGLFGYGDLTGVNTSIATADYADGDIYRTSRDMANQALDGAVTLPSQADFEELFALCEKEWATEDGVEGMKFTGPNGNSIFLPAAGSRTISSVSGEGTSGRYATGSINPSSSQFAISFSFTATSAGRTSTPVYEALSIRPVSTARNVTLNLEDLYGTWEIDNNNGETVVFNGPVWFYGADDSWRTVTNHEPVVGNSWCWDADVTNTWAFGGHEGCVGYMTLNPDGSIVVKCQEGAEQTGTYTVDLANKTITSTVPLLTPSNFPEQCASVQEKVKILSSSKESLQLGFYAPGDQTTRSVNMIPQGSKYGYAVNAILVDNDWGGTWALSGGIIGTNDLEGTHTIRYEGSLTSAAVTLIDIVGLSAAYPNAIAYISEIRCDGNAIPFDGNRFYYGDIEGNGNFRLQLFNKWGAGASGEKIAESPFSNLTDTSYDPAFSCSSSIEIDYVIMLDPQFSVNLITIANDWGGTWGSYCGSFAVTTTEAYKLAPSQTTFETTYTNEGHPFAQGPIMTFFEVPGFYAYFPGTHSTLEGVWLDGVEKTGWDASKIYDTNDGGGYRVELWNMYGTSSANGCAFGTPQASGEMPGLAFSTTQRVCMSIRSLFKTPNF